MHKIEISRAWLIAAALVAVLAGSPAALAQAQVSQPCFKWADATYQTNEEIQQAFDACYPVGANVAALVAQLERSTEPGLAPYEGELEPLAGFLGSTVTFYEFGMFSLYYQFARFQILANGKNAHLVVFYTDHDDRLLASMSRVLYFDEDFSARGVPFRFENFLKDGPDVKAALRSLVRGSRSLDEALNKIRDIMTGAGAREVETVSVDDGAEVQFFYKEPSNIFFYLRLADWRWVVTWKLNRQGEVTEILIGSP